MTNIAPSTLKRLGGNANVPLKPARKGGRESVKKNQENRFGRRERLHAEGKRGRGRNSAAPGGGGEPLQLYIKGRIYKREEEGGDRSRVRDWVRRALTMTLQLHT